MESELIKIEKADKIIKNNSNFKDYSKKDKIDYILKLCTDKNIQYNGFSYLEKRYINN